MNGIYTWILKKKSLPVINRIYMDLVLGLNIRVGTHPLDSLSLPLDWTIHMNTSQCRLAPRPRGPPVHVFAEHSAARKRLSAEELVPLNYGLHCPQGPHVSGMRLIHAAPPPAPFCLARREPCPRNRLLVSSPSLSRSHVLLQFMSPLLDSEGYQGIT